MSANANAWQARGTQVNGPTQGSKEGVLPGERILLERCRLRKGFSADQYAKAYVRRHSSVKIVKFLIAMSIL